MKNLERIEWQVLNKMRMFLHSNMVNSYEDSTKLIYELCYLRLLSLCAFKNIACRPEEITIERFSVEYANQLHSVVLEDLKSNNELEVHFDDIDKAISLAYEVLSDLVEYRNALKDIKPLIGILCGFNGIVIKNIMSIDCYNGGKMMFNTPEQICKLSNYLLDLTENDEVLDICSGYGNYLVSTANYNSFGKLTGIEITSELSLLSKIRLIALTNQFEIKNQNAFDIDVNKKYDKIFCNYPWGMRYQKYELDYVLNKTKNMRFSWEKMSGSSTDWLFINLATTLLKNSGTAVIMMPAGPLFKSIDEQYRKDLIDNNLIQAIIKIPVLTRYTSIAQYLLVLKENLSGNIKFIDLSEQVDNKKSLSPNIDMKKIFEILNEENNQFVKTIGIAEIAQNGFILTAENYIGKKEIEYHNPEKLSNYVIDVFRGYQITSKEQKELESEYGEYEVLLISDIHDGIISNELTKINPKNGKYDRYLLKENDLIISSKGTRIKIAVVENIKDRKIIASGNLIVLRLDSTKLNPLYLEMFLNSQIGQTILNRIQTGTVIISINPSKLIDITISTLPIEKQNMLATKYNLMKKQILLAKEHVTKLEQEFSEFYESDVERMF